jgi:hypothetical protein
MNLRAKNLLTGWILAGIVLCVVVYSLTIIKTRGRLPEPENLTLGQRIWRGL